VLLLPELPLLLLLELLLLLRLELLLLLLPLTLLLPPPRRPCAATVKTDTTVTPHNNEVTRTTAPTVPFR